MITSLRSTIGVLIAAPLFLAGCAAPILDNGWENGNGAQVSPSPSSPPQATTHPDIVVFTPEAGDTIASPVTITGEARGTWYFEADFPVRILDADGNELAVVPAQAQGEWMTTDFVPFTVTLAFTPTTSSGTLVLEKSNPSGLPEHAASIEIPVQFDQ